MTHFDIVNGPSKFDLMVSLFDNNAKPRRTVRFFLDHGHELDVAITMIQQEDGSGESWNFTGTATYADGGTSFHVRGYFGTRSRKGTLTREVG
jgi:hypothetical protein